MTKNKKGFFFSRPLRIRFHNEDIGKHKVIPVTIAKIKDGSMKGKGVVWLSGSGVIPDVFPANREINPIANGKLFERKNIHPSRTIANV